MSSLSNSCCPTSAFLCGFAILLVLLYKTFRTFSNITVPHVNAYPTWHSHLQANYICITHIGDKIKYKVRPATVLYTTDNTITCVHKLNVNRPIIKDF